MDIVTYVLCKKMVDPSEAGANNYTLPIASSTLGGVKTTSTETDMTHYEPAPISATGVVYTKICLPLRNMERILLSSTIQVVETSI